MEHLLENRSAQLGMKEKDTFGDTIFPQNGETISVFVDLGLQHLGPLSDGRARGSMYSTVVMQRSREKEMEWMGGRLDK